MITKFHITRYAWDSNTESWSTTPTYITTGFDIEVSTALGETKDTFSLKILNTNNTPFTQISVQDKLEIRLLINNDTPSASNLLIVGIIKQISEQVSDKTKVLRIEGASFGEIASTGLVFFNTPTSHSMTVMDFLSNCVNSVQLRNRNRSNTRLVTWSSSNPVLKYDNTTNTYTGAAFPVLNSGNQVREFDKSLAAVLDKYLVNDYTGDGKYFWYVNSSNEVVVRKRYVGITNPVKIEEGVNIITHKTGLDIGDVKNYVIVKCGKDYNNRPITTRADDPVSRSKHGFKYFILTDEQIAQKIKNTGIYEGDNDALREAVKEAGRAAGEDFIALHNTGVVKIDLTLAPTIAFSVGDKVQVTIPSYNLTNKQLRVKEISWDIDSTNITLIEEVAQ